ncbi:MAG: hypothetical protein CMP61_08525 [Flavobacteriales bacterium]|nr:hypothetical protein [Flavobacteriales bacterium]|tara:strand:- start:21376 stop:25098 length:3723 start_codon:yes stop_codon:yes gene_type:complete
MSKNILERLKTDGEELLRALRKKNAEQGLRNLLTELYPDNAHFIYELLQNAEDTNATNVKFVLEEDKLTFIHNGSRLFIEDDIVAITNIGVGTKKDDVNTIGKFGVGFKAVFAYTELPKVYSGEYNFEIRNLYIPQEIPAIKKDDSETVFVFPFNNNNKPRDKAYKEVNDSLSNINRTTLLFLNSISEIEIKISDESYKINKHTDRGSKVTKIRNTRLNKETKFLVFNKHLPKEDKLYVSIAFRLTKKGNITIDNEAKVSIFFPAEKETSNLKFHIHAPFASTVARDSITNRDENNELIELIADLLCEATEWIKNNGFLDDNFIGCLPIDDDNLSDFYKPIQTKIIDLFNTEPFLLCLNDEYHPAKDCWQSTNRLKSIVSTSDLKTLLKGKINNDCFWTTRPFQRNASGRVNTFLKSLELNTYSENDFKKNIVSFAKNFIEHPYDLNKELNEWKAENSWRNRELSAKIGHTLSSGMTNKNIAIRLFLFIENDNNFHSYYSYQSDEIKDIIRANFSHIVLTEFLSDKDNDWLKSFYEFLNDTLNPKDFYEEHQDYDDYYEPLKVFVKFRNGMFNFSKTNSYFPSKTNIKDIKSYIVHDAVYDNELQKKGELSKSKEFLKHKVGVKKIELEDEVKHILEKYRHKKEFETEENIGDIKHFLEYFKKEKKHFEKAIFDNFSFLISSDNKLKPAKHILIDTPYKNTSLVQLGMDDYKPLHKLYEDEKYSIDTDLLGEFLVAIGCLTKLPIIQMSHLDEKKKETLRNNYSKETLYKTESDFKLPRMEALESPQIESSLILWRELSNIPTSKDYFVATYSPNNSAPIRKCDSDVILELKKYSWIPNKEGCFFKPEEMSYEDLHSDFKINNTNGWLDKIDLGLNTKKSLEKQAKKKKLESIGLNESLAEVLQDNTLTEEEMANTLKKEILRKKQEDLNLKRSIENHNRNIDTNNYSLSPSIVLDTEDYRERAQQQLYKNITRSEKKKPSYDYSKKVKIGKPETREFLKKQYQGHCQICGFTFSQSGGKGNHFEIFDWLSEKISKQESNIIEAGTSLSLCSRCHSILKHGDFEAKFLDSIQEIENTNYSEFAQQFDLILESEEVPKDFDFIEMDMYKLPIRKLNTYEHIFFTEEHFIHFHNVLTLSENIEDEDCEEQIEKKENSIVVEKESPEIESKIVVEIGNIVTVKYSNSNNPFKLKIVSTAQNITDKYGNNLISASSPFGRKIRGKPEGYIFEMGKNMVEIINIE